MLEPVTILTALAYAITKSAATDPNSMLGSGVDLLAQLFGGAAGNSFHGDLENLRAAFLNITKPDNNQELERAAARSALHANLFCLMEALGEPMEPAAGKLAQWRQCIQGRLPQTLREIRRPSEGFFKDAERAQLLQAKQGCEDELKQIESRFTPVAIDANRMLITIEDDYAGARAHDALTAIEKEHGRLPDHARDIFARQWFAYLCGSFHHEIKHSQPVANILLSISLARVEGKIDAGFVKVVRRIDETQELIRSSVHPATSPLDPYATVPPLPPNFIDRPEITEPLREKLLSGVATVALTAIEGMGGVGKSMVALGLCHDPRVREAFPDGIVWLTIGKESTVPLEERIKGLASALNAQFQVYSPATYQSLLKDKQVLVVLDDVWRQSDVEPFLLGSGRAKLLYTSRDKTLAGPLGADSEAVGVLEELQARRFLARWSGRENAPLPEPEASGILTECKGLALGLAMIGGALRGQSKEEWGYLLDDLKQARLKHIAARPGGYAYETLHASIQVSVDALDPDSKARYLRLAVLLEDMSAPEALLRILWGGQERDVHRTARLFVDRSLASRDNEGIRLHDFQLDYVRGEHADPESLALQHSALLLSSHVVRSDPEQFAGQMTGRLLAHASQPGIAAFLNELGAHAPRPQLRPLRAALAVAGGPVRRVLQGHTASVGAVALTADGKRAVSGSGDQTLRVWDLEGDQEPRVLEGHTGWVRAVALTADGKRAVSGSDDRTLRVWDLEGGQEPRVLQGHTGPVWAVALTADGKRAVSGSGDRTLRVWDLEGGQEPRVLQGHTDWVRAVALTADGKRAVSGSDDRTLRVWDLEGGQEPRVLQGHTGWVGAVALTADGKRAVSGSDDQTLRVWDLEGGQEPRVLQGHTGWVRAVALTADGKRAVSGAGDETLRVWDLEGGQEPRVLQGHTDWVRAVALTADGKRAVSGSDDGTLRVWDLEGGQEPRVLEGHTGWVLAVALTADGKRAVSGSDDQTLRVWDLEGGQEPRVLEGHTGWVRAVALTADGKRAVSGSDDQTLRVWDLEGGQEPRVLEGHTGGVRAVALTADGKRAVSGSDDQTLRVWDLEGGQEPRVLEGHTGWVLAVALTADGKRAVSGAEDGTLRVWDLEGGQEPRVLEGHTGPVRAVALTADGKRAVSGADDRTLRVWDLEGGQEPRVLEGHTGPVWAVALTADGKRAVSGSYDQTLRVWDLEGGMCLAVFTCDAPVVCCAWGGGVIAAGDQGGHFHLFAWEE